MSDQAKQPSYTAPPGVVLLKATAQYNRGVALASVQAIEPNPMRTYVGQPRARVYNPR
jgi:hypothetical protein